VKQNFTVENEAQISQPPAVDFTQPSQQNTQPQVENNG
jgi:hypothetical protein